MIRHFASEISGIYVGKAWVSRFVHCYHNIVTMQARREIRIWRGLTQRHMEVRRRTVT
jgi:hypothetical protein